MVIGECRECARPLHAPVVVHCDFCGAPNAVSAAPIPGPAVLAALAEYTDAIYAIDDAPTGSNERDVAFEDWEAARSRMHAAIRAERDGARDGGA